MALHHGLQAVRALRTIKFCAFVTAAAILAAAAYLRLAASVNDDPPVPSRWA